MGLFKSDAEKIIELFGKLDDAEKETLRSQMFETSQQGGEEPKNDSENAANDAVADAEPQGEPVKEPEADKPAEPVVDTPKPTFEELFAKLQEENKKQLEDFKAEMTKAFEELKPKKVETKPFGLTEESKEYKATKKEKETSQDWLKKHFNG